MDAFAYDCILILQNMKHKQPAAGIPARDSNGFKPHSTANSGKFPQINSLKTQSHVTFKDDGDDDDLKVPTERIDMNKQLANRIVTNTERVFQMHSEEMIRQKLLLHTNPSET